jgi:hypothetical protein
MIDLASCVEQALAQVHHLAGEIGGRGSCTPDERRAAEYAAAEMRQLGARQVTLEPFWALPSTYWPFALAFGAALLGTLLVWLLEGRWVLAAAALLSGLGAGGMLAETGLAGNWMRRLLPHRESQNAVGLMAPLGEVRQRAVLCAHLDSHRTPVFYSSPAWHRVFGLLVGGALASMALAAAAYAGAYGLGALLGWAWVRWLGLAVAAVQLLALALCLHADRTPYSPGANDNGSGVGVALALARRLAQQPLAHTEVWLALTGCEEVGARGMAAFLGAHAAELGDGAFYLILDQVGAGRLGYLTADGMVRKHPTHPEALSLARRARAALPEVQVAERVGIAYTDALVATKRGDVALTLVALPLPGEEAETHWHQMSDTADRVDPGSLADACAFAWQVLQEVDKGDEGRRRTSAGN